MSEPQTILIAPYEVYLAPVSTSPPDVDESPASPWKLLGSSGKYVMDESCVQVSHPQTLVSKRSAGCTGPVKVARSEEDCKITCKMLESTAELYSIAMNANTVTETAAASGVPGTKKVNLHRGRDVTLYAMLCRGESAEMAGGIRQYVFPVVYESGSPTLPYNKTDVAGLGFEFTCLEDLDAATEAERFGYYEDQTADALA